MKCLNTAVQFQGRNVLRQNATTAYFSTVNLSNQDPLKSGHLTKQDTWNGPKGVRIRGALVDTAVFSPTHHPSHTHKMT